MHHKLATLILAFVILAASSLPASNSCQWGYCKYGHRYCKVGRTWQQNGEHCPLLNKK